VAEKDPEQTQRKSLGAILDRLITPLLALGGNWIKRPTDGELSAQSGRKRGGNGGLSAIAALELGRRALADSHYAEALVQFSLAIERDEKCMWAWHGRGDAFQLAGDSEAALAAYDRALELDAKSSLSQSGRGNALRALGKPDEARVAWTAALVLDPELKWAKSALAELDAGDA
jgi:tetratricopeptide (TPR) repeat protein